MARSTRASKTTVYEYMARAEAAGLSWPLPSELDGSSLEELLFPAPSAALAASRPTPDWRAVHRELKRHRNVTLRLLWLEWREKEPRGLGYSQFCLHYTRWLGVQDPVLRMEYAAGERMFIDFSGERMSVVDAETGELRRAEVFCAVLGASGLLYAEATWGQDLESWLMAHARAYEYYGGVAELTVPDNLKAGVSRACWYDPDINPSYLELARCYDTAILPTRIAKPRDKAAIEVGVQVAERWIIAPLRNRRFFSLGELNEAITEKLGEVNRRPFRGLPTSRRDLFLEIEQGALRPLPASRYEFQAIKTATVNIDYHVEFDHRYYSVPYRLIKQKVEIWSTRNTIEIYHQQRRIASHLRGYGRQRYITDPGHRPASHRAHLQWTPSRLIAWAGKISPSTAAAVEAILLSKPHPEHGYRACLGLMSLARKYGEDRLGDACTRALAIHAVSYTSIKSILAQNLDRQALPGAQLAVLPSPPAHDNLRGADYYRTEKEA
ncbi:MAG: IS21 family transposase [Candidatus Dormibacteraceae bacterium]